MQKITTKREEIKLIGITTRTNNTYMFEADIATNAIAAAVHKYVHQNLAKQIPNRINPGTIFCVYRLSNTVSVNSLNFLALIRKQSKYF